MSSLPLAHVIPLPGPVWGRYPARRINDRAAPVRTLQWRTARRQSQAVVAHSRLHTRAWMALDAALRPAELSALRSRLVREGLQGDALAQALGYAAACAEEHLAQRPRTTQLLAAAVLLDNRMAEMATGEGKTLAIGLAAAVAALCGMPVHVATANDYLAARDAQHLAPMFAALGLGVAALRSQTRDEASRRAAYQHDILYTTAKDLAFDFLRDQQAAAGKNTTESVAARWLGLSGPPVMRGLCLALLDEADSILLDEAEIPLVLSREQPQAARRALIWQAVALARQCAEGRDFHVDRSARTVQLTPAGEALVASLCTDLGGVWKGPRARSDLLTTALTGLHACQRDVHYIVRDGAIALLDDVTGRIAHGRMWSRGLHTVVALKEGLAAPVDTETVAQITFQRFFQRYWRLGGISGTLREAAAELRAVYGSPVIRIPLHRAARIRVLPSRRFRSREDLFEAVVPRVASLVAQRRPVLIGTDSVDDSLRLSASLAGAGIAHRVLNALNDAQEAEVIAQAGHAGAVTVATRMAGRGTDVALDDAARAAGGLHVLSCQHNASRRLDRQLAGRAGRHGDPGTVEMWFHNEVPGPAADTLPSGAGALQRMRSAAVGMPIAEALRHWEQLREEKRRAVLRAGLLEQDIQWERKLAFAGRNVSVAEQ